MGPATPPISDELVDVLRRSQQLGFLGARPIEQVIAHAREFVAALDTLEVTGPVLDLGSGGGVPGLVIAHDAPARRVILLDRRRTRTDFLARMVHRLGWQDRVEVWTRDAGDVNGVEFAAVVARGFGPPLQTLTTALDWVREDGYVVISEPPSGDRWAGISVSGSLPRAECAGSVGVPVHTHALICPEVSRETARFDSPARFSNVSRGTADPPDREHRPLRSHVVTETNPMSTDPEPASPAPEPAGSPTSNGEESSPAPSRTLPRIIALANQKGGVGKTTTTVNLGAALADMGLRTLIIDLDPQGNASTGLGIENRGLEHSMYHVLMHEEPLENVVEPTDVRNLFVAPASLDLAGAEIELVPAFSREQRLKRSIEAVIDDYDYVLIDCPPSLGLLTVNGLAAAREVLVPIQCEYYALEGLGQLLRNVDLVKRNLNPTLEVSTILCVMYDARTNLAGQVVDEVREHFGDKVLRSVIPRSVRLSEAPSFGQPITTFDPRSRGAIAYRDTAKEVHDATL